MAFDIRISVDRETGSRWLRAIQNLRRIYTVPVVATSAIPGLPTPPRAIAVAGERLLLDIGRAASRPEATDDPARLFGVFRYASSISGAHSTLTLAADYHGLDTHKKKVLSDEFGCGIDRKSTRLNSSH